MNRKWIFYNAWVAERNEPDHNFHLKNPTLINREINLLRQKCMGSALIAKTSTVNLRTVFFFSVTLHILGQIFYYCNAENKNDKGINKKKEKLNKMVYTIYPKDKYKILSNPSPSPACAITST